MRRSPSLYTLFNGVLPTRRDSERFHGSCARASPGVWHGCTPAVFMHRGGRWAPCRRPWFCLRPVTRRPETLDVTVGVAPPRPRQRPPRWRRTAHARDLTVYFVRPGTSCVLALSSSRRNVAAAARTVASIARRPLALLPEAPTLPAWVFRCLRAPGGGSTHAPTGARDKATAWAARRYIRQRSAVKRVHLATPSHLHTTPELKKNNGAWRVVRIVRAAMGDLLIGALPAWRCRRSLRPFFTMSDIRALHRLRSPKHGAQLACVAHVGVRAPVSSSRPTDIV